MGQPFPQQQYPQQPSQAQQQAYVPQGAPPPTFTDPYQLAGQQQQQAQPGGYVSQDQFASLNGQIQNLMNQVSQLTGAVNGLGQNQEALHQWLVAQATNIANMVSSISNSIKTEGAMGFLRGLFGGTGQPAQPTPVMPPQQQPQPQNFGFPPQGG